MYISDSAKKRFWERVDKSGECWEWTGCINSSGYGTIRVDGKTFTTHRLSFILHNNYEPSSKMDVMHSCDNKRCVNPAHLKEGTRLDNILDFISKGGKYGKIGEENSFHKITDKQYLEIKEQISKGKSVNGLAKKYGITHQSIFCRLERERARK